MAAQDWKRTKQARLMSVFDLYQKTVGGRPCSMEEVVKFAVGYGFHPTPGARDTEARQREWESLFETVAQRERLK